MDPPGRQNGLIPRPSASPDATADELSELRREVAQLRSEYARLRDQVQPRSGPPGHDTSPPTERIAVVGRGPGVEATRPMHPRRLRDPGTAAVSPDRARHRTRFPARRTGRSPAGPPATRPAAPGRPPRSPAPPQSGRARRPDRAGGSARTPPHLRAPGRRPPCRRSARPGGHGCAPRPVPPPPPAVPARPTPAGRSRSQRGPVGSGRPRHRRPLAAGAARRSRRTAWRARWPPCWPRCSRPPTVPPDSHFFDDLGADSMLMARFCARTRKRPDLPTVSIKDVYRHTTHHRAGRRARRSGRGTGRRDRAVARRTRPRRRRPAARRSYHLCALLQLLLFLGVSGLGMVVLVRGFEWISASPTLPELYLRSVAYSSGTFVATTLLSIVAKWTLIGRWKPRQIPVWSLAYVRFWLVKTLIRANPLVRFAGTPLYSLYLRALGAKIGRGVAVLSPTVPVCTDLITIGVGLRHPQGLVPHRLPGGGRDDPDRPGHPGPGRLRGRDDRPRHRDRDGRRRPARALLVAAHRAVRAGRRRAGTAHRPGRPRSTTGWSAPAGWASCGG